MFNVLKWLIFFGLSLVFVVFAMANRDSVGLVLPISELKISVPLYIIFFGNIIIGIFLGSLFTIKSKLKNCLLRKRKDKEIVALKNEISGIDINSKLLSASKSKE